METSSLRNLAFLVSLGGLPACGPDKDGSSGSDGGSTDDPSSTSTTTTSTSSTSDPPTGGSMGATEGATGTSSTSAGVTDATTGPDSVGFITTQTTGSTGEGTTGAPPDVQVCLDFGDKLATCIPRYRPYADEYTAYCNQYFALGAVDGMACTDALDAFFACLNNLECKDFAPELEMPMMCLDAASGIGKACPSLGP